MKKFSLFIIFGILFSSLFGQRLDYEDDVYELIKKNKIDEVYPILWQYQRQDPHFANTYVQIAMIAQFYAKEYDPLIDKKEVDHFIYVAKLCWGLAKGKMTEKEVRKNREFFENAKIVDNIKNLAFEDVMRFVEKRNAEIVEYEKNVKIIVANYHASVRHYNECIRLFHGINRKNAKIKDIYLNVNDSLLQTAKNLSASFDSTLFYFQEYKTALKNYPVKKYNPTYQLQPIITFRLEGLTSSNFLKNEVPIWDYGTWVRDLFATLNSEIKENRNKAMLVDGEMNQKIEDLSTANFTKETPPFYSLDAKLVNKIEKYDFQSVLAAFLTYKEQKIKFLCLLHSPLNNKNDTNFIPLPQRARFYESLLQEKNFTDSLNSYFSKQISKRNVRKYQDFFSIYQGEDGIKKYSTKESTENKNLLNQSFENLKFFAWDEINKRKNDSATVSHNKKNIPLYVQIPDFEKCKLNEYFTTAISSDENKNTYLTGFYKTSQKATSCFVAKMDKHRKIEWVKTFTIKPNSQETGTVLQANENGCAAILSANVDGTILNIFLRLDGAGKEISKKELAAAKFLPRIFVFDEINEKMILISKGIHYNSVANDFSQCYVSSFSAAGDTLWNSRIEFDGNVADMVKVDTVFYVFGNFAKLTLTDGKSVNSQAKTNSFVAQITEKGKILKLKPFFNTDSYFVMKVTKINSETINLIGIRSEPQDCRQIAKNKLGNIFYGLMNLKTELYFTNK